MFLKPCLLCDLSKTKRIDDIILKVYFDRKKFFPAQMGSHCAVNMYHVASSVYSLVYSAILYINTLHDIEEPKLRDTL